MRSSCRNAFQIGFIGGVIILSLLLVAGQCIHVHTETGDTINSSRDSTNNVMNTGGKDWYDCSSEVGIPTDDKVLSFSNVKSVPSVVTPKSGQKIYKTIQYEADADSNPSAPTLETITVDFHQYYKVFGKKWMTFLVVHNVDECKEHSNLCPLEPGEKKDLVTVHPPLNPMTPYGWYRSRQIYKDGETGKKIGCVDMSFQYAPEQEHQGLLRGHGAIASA
mmetsp:Transcript_27118/g.54772  ORF Transcript_27118/g.54772 Transcript_27118/m.54772 type:complete len:220 (+) Transcript_27118:212-871(+)